MRKQLWIADNLETDHVIDSVFWVQKKIDGMGYGLEVQEEVVETASDSIEAHAYEPVIKEMEDIEQIAMPDLSYDKAWTEGWAQRLDGLFGDVLPVEICGLRSHTYNSWDTVVCWTGVQNVLMDLIMRPDYCHAIMRRLTDAVTMRMDQVEKLGLLSGSNPKPLAGSGEGGPTPTSYPRRTATARPLATKMYGAARPRRFLAKSHQICTKNSPSITRTKA